MFFKVLMLSIVLVSTLLADDLDYYKETKIKEEKMYFPKSDTEYIDYLVEQNGESDYELAITHLKLGETEVAKRYIKLYEEKETTPQDLLKYYRLSEDYEKVEEILANLLKNSDEHTRLKYKILIEQEVRKKNLPIGFAKYSIGKVEKLYFFRNDEDNFKTYFNSEKWTRSEMNDLVEKLKMDKLSKGSSAEKLFDMFATDRDKLQRKYFEISGLEDERGYFKYFEYAKKNGLTPEIKTEQEKGYYLKFSGEIIEVKNINTEVPKDLLVEKNEEVHKINEAVGSEEKQTLQKNITQYEKEIREGNLKDLNEYVKVLEKEDIVDIEQSLENLTRESYVAYLLENNRTIAEGDKTLGATYLYEQEEFVKLFKYKEYLSKEQLSNLSRKDRKLKEYYAKKYPVARDNIDSRKSEYFYFAESPSTNTIIIEELVQKRYLEPQERYYLAVHYHKIGDYVKSYRETGQLFGRYKLSDKIFKLHADNITKLKEKGTNSEKE